MKAKKKKLIKIDLSGCKNIKEAGPIIDAIAQGKVKIIVENLKH